MLFCLGYATNLLDTTHTQYHLHPFYFLKFKGLVAKQHPTSMQVLPILVLADKDETIWVSFMNNLLVQNESGNVIPGHLE